MLFRVLINDLRDGKERVAIKVVGLGDLGGVLEDDFDEVAEGGVDDVGGDDGVAGGDGGVWGVRDEVVLEDLVGDTVVLGELERGFGVDVGDTVECVTELAADLASGADQLDGAGDVNLTVVV